MSCGSGINCVLRNFKSADGFQSTICLFTQSFIVFARPTPLWQMGERVNVVIGSKKRASSDITADSFGLERALRGRSCLPQVRPTRASSTELQSSLVLCEIAPNGG